MRMNTDRAEAFLIGGLGIALLAVVPNALVGLSQAMRAPGWDSAMGTITAKTDVSSPAFKCFTPTQRYSIVEYRFIGADGKHYAGAAHTPRGGERYTGAAIQIRFNRFNPRESLPSDAIDGHMKAHGGSLAVSFLLGVPLLLWARRIWPAPRMRTDLAVDGDARKSGTPSSP
jgi:hypothetical protein